MNFFHSGNKGSYYRYLRKNPKEIKTAFEKIPEVKKYGELIVYSYKTFTYCYLFYHYLKWVIYDDEKLMDIFNSVIAKCICDKIIECLERNRSFVILEKVFELYKEI
jgi:hypothetical protein